MKTLLLAAIFTVALVTADPTKPGCCVPPQWEGVELVNFAGVTDSKPTYTNAYHGVSYDETNQIVAYTVTNYITGYPTQHLKDIRDFQKGKQYVIDLEVGSCQVFTLTSSFSKTCLPPIAQPSGQYSMGFGDNTLSVLTFKVDVGGKNYTITAATENCLPLMKTEASVLDPDTILKTSSFYNLTLGIKDRSVFNVPTSCSKA